MTALITWIQHLIQSAGWLGVFVGSIVEEVISIIPSALVQLGSGFALLEGMVISGRSLLVLVLHVAIPAAVGATIGSVLWYAIGRWAGDRAIKLTSPITGINVARWHEIEEGLKSRSWDDVVFFFARAFPLMPSVLLSLGAGLIRMNLGRYLWITASGMFFRAGILGFIGWQVGRGYEEIAPLIDKAEKGGLVIVLLIVVILFFIHRHRKNKKRLKDSL